MTTFQEARLAAAQRDFVESPTVPNPRFTIEAYPFQRFTIETEIQLPTYAPFSKEAYDYFGDEEGGICGITQCEETGTYMLVGRIGITVEDITEFIESL